MSQDSLKKFARIVVAIFFISTSILKIFSFPQFVFNIQEFDLLPHSTILSVAIFIVLSEMISGLGLAFNIYTKPISVFLILLVSLFSVGIIINLMRHNAIDCGCFGSYFSEEITWWSVGRNFTLQLILYWISHGFDKKMITE